MTGMLLRTVRRRETEASRLHGICGRHWGHRRAYSLATPSGYVVAPIREHSAAISVERRAVRLWYVNIPGSGRESLERWSLGAMEIMMFGSGVSKSSIAVLRSRATASLFQPQD